MSKAKNMVVAQSGGPSPVINNSLRGLVEAARGFPQIGTIYAGWHGIEGVLKEELLELSSQPAEEIALLRVTPAAGSIGTCRYKLRESQKEDFDRIIEVFQAHNVGYFCYIGGNDSMDTANKVARLANERGLGLVGVGVPKTIDNDVGDSAFKLIDHTPGYGSTARYWAHMVQFANEENAGMQPGRPRACPAGDGAEDRFHSRRGPPGRPAARAARCKSTWPSGPVTLEQMADNVNGLLRRAGRAIVVVSEGLQVADIGEVKDSFGHTQIQLQPVDRRAGRHQRPQRQGAAGQGGRTGQRPRHRPAAQHDLRLDRRSGRGVSCRPKGGRAGGTGHERFHGDHPPRAGTDL